MTKAVAHIVAHVVAHAVTHAEVLGLCLREQLVTHAAHFKFQSLQVFHEDIVDYVGGWMSEVSLTLAQASVCRPGNQHSDEEKCTLGSG